MATWRNGFAVLSGPALHASNRWFQGRPPYETGVVVTREAEGVAGRYSRGIVQAPLENPPQVGAVHLGLSTVLRKTRLQTRLFCSNFVFNRIFIAIRY